MKRHGGLLRTLQLGLGVGISAVCLWLALRNVPFAEFTRALDGADYRWVALALVAQVVAVVTRSERWRLLVGRDVRPADAFWALSVGYLFTNVLPFRLGEAARVAALSSRARQPAAQIAATAVLDHLLDVATILIVLVSIWPAMQVPVEVARAGLVFAAALLGCLVVILLLAWLGERSERWVRGIANRLVPRLADSLADRWRELLDGFAALTGDAAGLVLGGSVVTWAASIVVYWCVLRAFVPSPTLVEAAFMVVALALAISVPAGPGFIGVFHWVGQQALVLPFGAKYDPATALAITVTAHLVYYLFTSALGIGGLWHFGASIAQLRSGRMDADSRTDLAAAAGAGGADHVD